MEDNEMEKVTSILIENKKLKTENEALRVAAHFICDDDVEVNLRNQVYQQQLKLQQLEAERSTLLKAVDLLKRTRYPFPEHPTLQEEIELFLAEHKL